MELLSEDDLNLKEMTPEELDRAWDLWFELAQSTNDSDPPFTHGVFVLWNRLPGDTQPEEEPAVDQKERRKASRVRDATL